MNNMATGYLVGIELDKSHIVNVLKPTVYRSIEDAYRNTIVALYNANLLYKHDYEKWMEHLKLDDFAFLERRRLVVAVFDKASVVELAAALQVQKLEKGQHNLLITSSNGYVADKMHQDVSFIGPVNVKVDELEIVDTNQFYQQLFVPDYTSVHKSHLQSLLQLGYQIGAKQPFELVYQPKTFDAYYFNILDTKSLMDSI